MEHSKDGIVLQLAETRHRSANSFQLVMSLVRFRLNQTADPVARDQLLWVIDVIRTMGLLQRHLQSDGGPNFGDYLNELVKYWQSALKDQSVLIEADVDSIDLSPGVSSTLALIVQELVTNTVKHGLNGADGRIHIEFRRDGSEAELTVADNGQGMPKATPKWPGKGMQLMRRLSSGIGAQMEIENGSPGTIARIRLPLTNASSCPSSLLSVP